MSKFKKNRWLYGLWMVFFLFASFIISFIVIASKTPVSLVINDYYKAEVDYQSHIDKMHNLDSIGNTPIVTLNLEDGKALQILLPEALSGDSKGIIGFYKASDEKADRQFDFNPKDRKQIVYTLDMKKGWWKLKLDWTTSGTAYYYEKSIYLN